MRGFKLVMIMMGLLFGVAALTRSVPPPADQQEPAKPLAEAAAAPAPQLKPQQRKRVAQPAERHSSVGDRTYLTAMTIGCPDSSDLDRAIELGHEGDTLAMAEYAATHGCTFLDGGQPVILERPSLFGNVGVRISGQTTIYWVNPYMVKR